MSTIEELLERYSNGSGLEIREYGRSDQLCNTMCSRKLTLTAPTVGIVRSRIKAMEFFCNQIRANNVVPVIILEVCWKRIKLLYQSAVLRVVAVVQLSLI
jgi:hypothetical protein